MTSRSLNVILFGETGVGKSSVINLISGRTVANVSNIEGCTMSSTLYRVFIEGRGFNIWDTVGLGGPEYGVNGFLPPIEKSLELIQRLSAQGGVDLLLFCMRGKRITATTRSNYKLLYEVLCWSKVPIAFVITHLERKYVMEEWWIRNMKSLEKYGIIENAGHACVTGIPG
ncbi:hypothetical protein PAXINDRAFT_82988, partial [Paxillus involutus ATCC 200175]